MKKALSALLMGLSLLIGFQQAIIVIHFNLNQPEIEQIYCINKDKPRLRCHGTCHLKKQLQKTKGSEADSNNTYQKIDIINVGILVYQSGLPTTERQHKKPAVKGIFYKQPFREIWVPPPIV